MILGLSFVSCNNFLKASETANDIKAAIAYANAKSYLIKVTSQEGTGTIAKPAAGEALKKATDSFEIRFEPITDYEFLSWEVFSDKLPAGANINDYIVIENPQSTETMVTFKKELENIVITATVVDRPRVISYSPMASGILKDSSIIVQFNRDMDSDSIYYTDPEIIQLKAEGKIPLSTTVKGAVKYYGYQKAVDGVVETFFKNISIVNNKTDENLASYFNAPVFESSRVLSIAANKDKPLDDYTQVLVLLDKNFFYSHKLDDENKKPVTMAGSELWMYQVNNETDEKPLVFQKKNDNEQFSFKLRQADTNTLTSGTTTPSIDTNGNNIKNFSFLQNKAGSPCAYLDVQLQDVTGGSGPTNTFNVIYERILESDYTTAGKGENKNGSFSFEYQVSTSEDAVYKGDLPLALPQDGLYRLYFDFADRSGNHLYYPKDAEKENSKTGFYVTKDETPVSVSNLKLTSDNDTNYTLNWSNSSKDYKNAVISWGNGTDNTEITKGTYSKQFTVNSGNTFDITITYTDYAGNTVVQTIPKFLTGYAFDKAPSFDKYGIPNVFFENDSLSNYGLTAIAQYSDGTSNVIPLPNITKTDSSTYKSEQSISNTYEQNEEKIQISKTITLENYYIAASGAKPTQTPIRQLNYSTGTGVFVAFGDFPQTIAEKYNHPTWYSDSPVCTDRFYGSDMYLGKDGYFYVRCMEDGLKTNAIELTYYTNDLQVNAVTANSYRYFKVEPIIWRVLNPNDEGKKILLAEDFLIANIPFYGSQNNRTLNDKTIYPNNYKYSNIRAWLNGINNQFVTDGGTANEFTIDWSGKGFLQTAFTASAQNLILETEIDNSEASANPTNHQYNEGVNSYCCDNTFDKIFLLSEYEATIRAYRFDNDNVFGSDSTRIRIPTDFARANHARQYQEVYNGGPWYLRSPYHKYNYEVRYVTDRGKADVSYVVTSNGNGIVPAIYLESIPN